MGDDIVAQLRAFDNGYSGTHYADCWQSHPICAIMRAADEIERLREELTVEKRNHTLLRGRMMRLGMVLKELQEFIPDGKGPQRARR
jgi:hypothetical protein